MTVDVWVQEEQMGVEPHPDVVYIDTGGGDLSEVTALIGGNIEATVGAIKNQTQTLIDRANSKTGNSDADLTTAQAALIDGYGFTSGVEGLNEIDFIRAVSEGYRAIAGSSYTNGLLIINRFPSNGYYWIILWHNNAKPCLTLYSREGTLKRGNFDMRMTTNNTSSGNYMRFNSYNKFKFNTALDTTSYTRQRFGGASGHLTLDVAPGYVHPAITKYFTYGVENHMEEVLNKIKFKDLFTLSNYEDSHVHVMIFLWGSTIYCGFFKEDGLPYIDYGNSYIKFSLPFLMKEITTELTTYKNRETGASTTICDKVGVSLLNYNAQTWGSYFSTMIADFEAYIYFNSFDLKDENGNVILEANCTIDDFIE